ncbi:hypothetical protein PsorP6_016893 [Peronosclerospora sorghi]|uniref:Uncharacterized protein n=1 Tax=Peronosclerospora sorghi TaxID=230839 RepID=A0ACC0WD16_9STRA|nr:hypothetical protein PsorP6_016893 [Peronosclerospora sorghi]
MCLQCQDLVVLTGSSKLATPNDTFYSVVNLLRKLLLPVCTLYGFIVEKAAEVIAVVQPEPQSVRKIKGVHRDWDMTSCIPDVVVINLGINDLSPPTSAETDIITGYATFLLEIARMHTSSVWYTTMVLLARKTRKRTASLCHYNRGSHHDKTPNNYHP